MPRKPSVRTLRTVDAALESALREMPPEEVRCRSGWHRWARDTVLPDEPWPDVVRVWPANEGRYRIEDPCVDCGLACRVTKTLPGGELDAFATTSIVYDEDWVAIPQGLDRRKRVIRAEAYRRGARRNQGQLQQALARTAARNLEPVVPVRFAHAGSR